MRPHDKRWRRDQEEVDARIDALGRPSSGRIRRKHRSKAGPTVFGILLIVAVIGGIYLMYLAAVAGDDEPAGEGPVRVEVVKGDTLSDVADKLEAAGVIKSAFVFKLQARYEGYGTEIQTGRYTFERGQDTDVIFHKLAAGKAVPTIAVTIPEGLTIHQTANTVAQDSGVPAAQFERAARETDYDYAFLEHPGITTTEGYLYPARYDFEKGATARQIVDRLLGQYLVETQNLDVPGARDRLGLTEHQLVTVASLIEREAASPEEKPLVASVIYNRLDRDMPLQIDASIQYALDAPKENLSLRDLKVRSPYNTYEHRGLPPGPICSPSSGSLEAALNPDQTNYLYYVLKADGQSHFFTDDYQDFLREKEKAGR